MKKKVISIYLILIFSIGVLQGCIKKDMDIEENFTFVNGVRMQVKNEGCYYLDGYTEQMKFYDFKLNMSIAICDKPNCRHNSSDCNAYIFTGFDSGVGCYRDKLYFFDVSDVEMPFYQSDKNGSNRKVVTKLNENKKYSAGCSISMPMYFVENQVLLKMEYPEFLDESYIEENGNVQYIERFWQIIAIDLNSGEIEILKEAVEIEEDGWTVRILDYIDEKIIYDLADKIYIYDLQTRQEEKLLDFTYQKAGYCGVIQKTGKIYYTLYEGEGEEETINIYERDIRTREETCIVKEKIQGKSIVQKVSEEFIYYEIFDLENTGQEDNVYKVYSVRDCKIKEVSKEEYKYAPTYIVRDWYVTFSDDGYVCIPKKAYEEKDWSQVQVIGFI